MVKWVKSVAVGDDSATANMSDDIRRRLRGNAPPFVGRGPMGMSAGQRTPAHHPGPMAGCPPAMFPRSGMTQPLVGGGPCGGGHQQPRTPIPPPLTAAGVGGGAAQPKFSFGIPPPSTPPGPNPLAASAAGPIRRASSRPLMTARAPPVAAPQSSLHGAGRIGSKRRSIQLRLGSRPPPVDYNQVTFNCKSYLF